MVEVIIIFILLAYGLGTGNGLALVASAIFCLAINKKD
jgi:hypothetical protein